MTATFRWPQAIPAMPFKPVLNAWMRQAWSHCFWFWPRELKQTQPTPWALSGYPHPKSQPANEKKSGTHPASMPSRFNVHIGNRSFVVKYLRQTGRSRIRVSQPSTRALIVASMALCGKSIVPIMVPWFPRRSSCLLRVDSIELLRHVARPKSWAQRSTHLDAVWRLTRTKSCQVTLF